MACCLWGMSSEHPQCAMNLSQQGDINPIIQGDIICSMQGDINPNTQGDIIHSMLGDINPCMHGDFNPSMEEDIRVCSNIMSFRLGLGG